MAVLERNFRFHKILEAAPVEWSSRREPCATVLVSQYWMKRGLFFFIQHLASSIAEPRRFEAKLR
jgi:hypothetical protein